MLSHQGASSIGSNTQPGTAAASGNSSYSNQPHLATQLRFYSPEGHSMVQFESDTARMEALAWADKQQAPGVPPAGAAVATARPEACVVC